jgi:Glycosyl hydrolases family 2, sugar binding domain
LPAAWEILLQSDALRREAEYNDRIPMLIRAFVVTALFATVLPAQKPEWDNPAIIHIGTEPPHADMMVYPSAALAKTGDPAASPWFPLLDGVWKFHGPLRPAERPVDFYRSDFSDADWRDMPVPSNWQMHGYDIPIYTNIIYPWPQDPHGPPAPPYDYNLVGSYRMRFTVPESWRGRRVFLHFNGVDSCFYAWLNGVKLGYHEDSRTPAEFDITEKAEAGTEPAGRRSVSLRRRGVHRGPGYVAHERHLPRCLPMVDRRPARARFRGAHGPAGFAECARGGRSGGGGGTGADGARG